MPDTYWLNRPVKLARSAGGVYAFGIPWNGVVRGDVNCFRSLLGEFGFETRPEPNNSSCLNGTKKCGCARLLKCVG